MSDIYFVHYSCGPGMDASDIIVAESQEEADKVAYEMAKEHSYSYEGSNGYLDPDDYEELSEDEIAEEIEQDRENSLDYYAEIYVPVCHDMLRAGGGSFTEEPLYKEFYNV